MSSCRNPQVCKKYSHMHNFSQNRCQSSKFYEFCLKENIKPKTGFPRSWKTMENLKIKSRPGNVMENEHLAKSHGKIMEFLTFTNVFPISFEKMC